MWKIRIRKSTIMTLAIAACLSVAACSARENDAKGADNTQNVLRQAEDDFETVKKYGLDNVGKSDLVFKIDADSLEEHKHYYIVDATFYHKEKGSEEVVKDGVLAIRKNAAIGSYAKEDYESINEDKLQEDESYDAVVFDSEGYVTLLGNTED